MESKEDLQHLYWRAGFGLSPQEWQEKKKWPISKAIDELFVEGRKAARIPLPFAVAMEGLLMKNLSKERRQELKKEANLKITQLSAEWINRMADPKQPALLEKMTLFWHGHFACITQNPRLAAQQLNTLREHALGNFREMILAVAKDVSMIRFLNNQQNKKATPNENFARELMELFTIGRENYTEQDIKEAARAFTGWSSNFNNEFVFRKWQHDFGRKTFMGKSGNFNGEEIINIILSKKETARFLSQKVYRFFVSEKIKAAHVEQLANRFYNSEYDIADLMKFLFTREWFYSNENVGIKIKSPVELMAGLMRSLRVKFPDHIPARLIQHALGQVLFKPPNVAGWEGGKAWIDNSTLLVRLNLANYLFLSADVPFKFKSQMQMGENIKGIKRIKAEVDLRPLIKMCGNASFREIKSLLSQYFFQAPSGQSIDKMDPYLIKNNREDFIKSLAMRLLTLPEYQLC